ncbi:uncharacterized protein G2W53_016863 [Senna tora]|uniref:Uncharacterized protein n=1 Tax=Senna tora TaxID=362788 RepID=A0A834TQA4_9FABA|nr:uncharacterized protein G2W53_016863 [Senna tora]
MILFSTIHYNSDNDQSLAWFLRGRISQGMSEPPIMISQSQRQFNKPEDVLLLPLSTEPPLTAAPLLPPSISIALLLPLSTPPGASRSSLTERSLELEEVEEELRCFSGKSAIAAADSDGGDVDPARETVEVEEARIQKEKENNI